MIEFELIDVVTRDCTQSEAVLVGVGDDGAVLAHLGNTVVSTDILVENVHFRRSWSDPDQVGRKCVAVNVSDIEAMGARPTAIVISLAFPAELQESWVLAFARGVQEECQKAGVSLVGGDMSSANLIVANGTALGESNHQVTRSGAKVGDQVAFYGTLGWAAAGHAALMRGFRSPREVVSAALCPNIPYGQGLIAAQAGAHAMIDISDGLVQDLGHISEKSGVGIDIFSSSLPCTEAIERVAAATGKDPQQFLLAGGEDYALVATFAQQIPPGWQVIGQVVEGNGVTVDGRPSEYSGWDHFTAK